VDSPHSLESNSHPHEERLSSIPSTSHDRIIRLLATAMSNLYGNRVLANDCIVSASALLRISAVRGLSRSEGSPPMGGLAPWQAKRVRAYITAHIATKIRASELAEHISLSTSHFFRAFRETFGEAPMAYVASERMRHAQALLLTTEESLSQVSLSCGLFDQAHFTRTFRRIVGLTPSVWRRQFSARTTRQID
jgi:AraC family transcriptional regulator